MNEFYLGRHQAEEKETLRQNKFIKMLPPKI